MAGSMTQDHIGCHHEVTSRELVTCLRNAQPKRRASGLLHPGRQSEVGAHIASALEAPGILNGSVERKRGDRSDARHLHQTTCDWIGGGQSCYSLIFGVQNASKRLVELEDR